MAQSVGEEVHLTFVDEDDDLVLENEVNIMEGIGISNVFLKIALLVKPLHDSPGISSLNTYCLDM